jgi:hypothetical protein
MPDTSSPTTEPTLGGSHEPLMRRFIPLPDNVILAAHFRPTPADTDGISVSFQYLPNPIQRVLADTRRSASEYSVCVFDLNGLADLSVVPSPTNADLGHATIPEICPPYAELKKNDERRKRILAWIAQLVLRAQTIHNAGDPF